MEGDKRFFLFLPIYFSGQKKMKKCLMVDIILYYALILEGLMQMQLITAALFSNGLERNWLRLSLIHK